MILLLFVWSACSSEPKMQCSELLRQLTQA